MLKGICGFMKTTRRKILLIAFAFLIVVWTAVLSVPAYASDRLTLQGDTITAKAGETVELTVNIVNNPGFAAMNLYYTYDTTQLTLINARNQASGLTFTYDKTSVWDGLSNYTKTGALVTLTFLVSDTAKTGEYEIKIHFIEAFNEDLDDVYATTVSGYIRIGCAHNNTEGVAEVPPTCTSEGYTAGVKCLDCGIFVSGHQKLDKLSNHTFSAWMKDSATHHKRTCACGQTEYAAHNWDNGTVTEDANHNQSGSRVYTCRDCGENRSEVIPQIEHTYDQKNTADRYLKTEASCAEAAVYYYSCTCGAKGMSTFTFGNANGHTPGADATCTTDQTCSSCGTVTTEKYGHEYREEKKDATCIEAGYTVYTCERCGTSYKDAYTDAKGHTPSEWIVDQEPAPGVAGSQHKACTDCGATLETGVIDALPVETESEGSTETDTEADTEAEETTESEPTVESESKQDHSASEGGCSGTVNANILYVMLLAMAVPIFVLKRKETF